MWLIFSISGRSFGTHRIGVSFAQAIAGRSSAMAWQTMRRDDSGETIESAVAAFLDAAIVVRQTGRTAMVECKLCGEQDENHAESCPVPAMEQWLFDAAKGGPEERIAIEQACGELGINPN
jgi:hypothetical protein